MKVDIFLSSHTPPVLWLVLTVTSFELLLRFYVLFCSVASLLITTRFTIAASS